MWTFLTILVAIIAVAILALVLFTWVQARKAEKAVPPHGKFVSLSTGPLHYVEKGEGPPIIMVHGLGGQLNHFRMGMVDDLSRDHRVIAIDRPGMGYSDRPTSASANLRAQAALVAEAIDALKLDRPLYVGHSLGGGIGLALALDHPDKICGLALLSPLAHEAVKPPAVFQGLNVPSAFMRAVLSWTVATPLGMKMEPALLAELFAPEAVKADFATTGGALLGRRPKSFRNTCKDYVAAQADLSWMNAHYGSLKVPVHILYGREDRILAARLHGEELAEKHDRIHAEIVEGGHMIPMTQPGRCADFVRRSDAAVRALAA